MLGPTKQGAGSALWRRTNQIYGYHESLSLIHGDQNANPAMYTELSGGFHPSGGLLPDWMKIK